MIDSKLMNYLSSILPALENLGTLGYWIIFLVSLLESLAVVGILLPGGTLIMIAGFLAAHGYLDMGDLILCAAFGAIIGDGISYYLGTKGTGFFQEGNRFFKLSHLERGKEFFQKHGSTSIFWGRFISPLRPIVPFVAGLSRMNKQVFLFWNVVSAFSWAASFILFGYFIGDTVKTVEIWSTRAELFLFFFPVCLFLIWLGIKRSSPFFAFLKSVLRSMEKGIAENPDIQRLAKRHPFVFAFLRERVRRDKFSGLTFTLLLVAFTYTLSLFFGTIQDVLNSELIVALDVRTTNLVSIFYDPKVVKVFLWITLFGKWEIIVSSAIIISLLCWLWGKRIYILPLWITIAGAELFNSLGKTVIHRARPVAAIYNESTLSFPSGHATIAVAFYGFLTYIILRGVKKWKYKIEVFFFALAFISSIGLSRLYLGVHFVSDVWGGYLLGFLWLIIGISISEWLISRKDEPLLPEIGFRRRTKVVGSISLMFAETLFYTAFALQYNPPRNDAREVLQVIEVDNVMDGFRDHQLPRHTETITSGTQEPLSLIIIAKDDREFVSSLESAGWYLADQVSVRAMLRLAGSVLNGTSYPTAPMTPSFWNARVHDFGFEKPTETQSVQQRHHARFWKTPFRLRDGSNVYAGTASLDVGIKWLITHRINPVIDSERDFIFDDLESVGLVSQFQKEQFVDSVLGKNFAGDQFFTDGRAYIIFLK